MFFTKTNKYKCSTRHFAKPVNAIKKIQQKISHNYPQMAIYNRLTSEETELAQKIISIINKNISNPELDANQISNLMGISRSGLYLKTKTFSMSLLLN